MHETNLLRAGAAMIDITPPPGTHLAGSGAGEHRPAQTVMDPLFAKAIVFEVGQRRVCMVILDLTIVTWDYTDQIRAVIGEHTGIAPEAIMVQATQTHSAPSLGYFMLDADFPLETNEETEYLRGGERAYGDRVAAAAVEAAVEAVGKLRPVRIGLGRGVLGDLAFNRRGIRRDGTIAMPKPLGREQQPFGIADICYLEGPMDPEVGVCCVQDMDMRPLAFLLHYTCHPVNVFGNPRPTGRCRRIGLAPGRGRCNSCSAPTQCRWSSTAVAATSTPGILSTRIAGRTTGEWGANWRR